jgi:hypothetical protein
MTATRWNDIHNDQVRLLRRYYRKVSGIYLIAAPAGTDIIRAACVGVGGQGQDPGGNAAYTEGVRPAAAGEVFQVQVGKPGTGLPVGDSWVRRYLTAEPIVYADRGRGTGRVQGSVAYSIGDVRRPGISATSSGGDVADLNGLGFGGSFSDNPIRAAGPGGGGEGNVVISGVSLRHCAGQGLVCLEFYSGELPLNP